LRDRRSRQAKLGEPSRRAEGLGDEFHRCHVVRYATAAPTGTGRIPRFTHSDGSPIFSAVPVVGTDGASSHGCRNRRSQRQHASRPLDGAVESRFRRKPAPLYSVNQPEQTKSPPSLVGIRDVASGNHQGVAMTTERGHTETVTTDNPEPRSALAPDAEEARSVSLADVLAARDRIAAHVHHTPLLGTATLGRLTGTSLALKAENLQRTGSFKARGALNAVLQLSPEQRARGIVTLSAGNHGQGLAYAAAMVGVRCVVFMPSTAVSTKVDAIRGYGAEARFAPSMAEIFAAMEAYRASHGLHFVHPFADPAIIAGQGTVGLEILDDCPEVEAIVVCVGGGGLLAGIALAVKAQRPEVRIVGVEPQGAAAVHRSLAVGRPVTLERIETIADGLAAPFAAALTQAIIERHVDDVVLVGDDEIVTALRLILERTKLLVEPAGAAAVAALLSGKAGLPQGTRSVATLSGGNVDRETLKRLL